MACYANGKSNSMFMLYNKYIDTKMRIHVNIRLKLLYKKVCSFILIPFLDLIWKSNIIQILLLLVLRLGHNKLDI